MSASFNASASLTPSPGHRDGVPARLQRLHHVLLLVRRHATEHRMLLERLAELLEILRKLPGVERPVSVRHAHPRRDGSDGVGVVAGDDVQRHALLREVLERRRRHRDAPAPRTARGPPRASPPAGSRLRAALRSGRGATPVDPFRRRLRPSPPLHRRARPTPARAHRAPRCRARRRSPRSTSVPTRTGRSRCVARSPSCGNAAAIAFSVALRSSSDAQRRERGLDRRLIVEPLDADRTRCCRR